MANKFPTNQSFQRLTNFPLDETTVFDTLAQAQDYAKNNPTAYKGQVVHVKDARTDTEINNDVNIYEETCYIDLIKNIVPICSFSYEAMGLFFDIIYEIFDGPTEETRNKLDKLYEIMYENYAHDFNDEAQIPTGDYKTQPWHPGNYNEYQIALKMVRDVDESFTNSNNIGMNSYQDQYKISYENANCTIEDINIKEGTHVGRYKIITFNKFPTRISFEGGNYIEEVIHMCNTSKITDMSKMFYDCKKMKYINADNFDTSNVTTMRWMFCYCNALTTLDLSSFDTTKVTDMFAIFAYCNNLTSLNVSSFNTSKVTYMNGMFSGCSGLTSLNVNKLDTSKVTHMNGMFQNCSGLINLNLSNFDTAKVTTMNSMFENCRALTNLDISNFDTTEVTDMSKMFQNCTSLELSNINMIGCSENTIGSITNAYNTTR